MQRRKVLKAGAAGAAVLAAPGIVRAQQQYKAEYKMSTVVGPAFAWGRGGEIFANLVRERTNGRINIKQYPGASLVQGQQDREFAAMRHCSISAGVGRCTSTPSARTFSTSVADSARTILICSRAASTAAARTIF